MSISHSREFEFSTKLFDYAPNSKRFSQNVNHLCNNMKLAEAMELVSALRDFYNDRNLTFLVTLISEKTGNRMGFVVTSYRVAVKDFDDTTMQRAYYFKPVLNYGTLVDLSIVIYEAQ